MRESATIITIAEAKQLSDLYLDWANKYRNDWVNNPGRKRFHDLYMALAQEYRKTAGLPPIQTKNVERHPERLAPVKVEATGTVKR